MRLIKKLLAITLFALGSLNAQYYSQCGQDKYVHQNFFTNLENGIFIDIGAHDGISLSNTYFFEKELNWSGICIEPNPEVFVMLQKNRTCPCIEGCIGPVNRKDADFLKINGPLDMLSGLVDCYDQQHLERIYRDLQIYGGDYSIIKVDCFRLNDILVEQGIKHVNFMSIDTEGGELNILDSIDFDLITFDVITVENNYNDPMIKTLMLSKGFQHAMSLEQDQLFIREDFLNSKEFTCE